MPLAGCIGGNCFTFKFYLLGTYDVYRLYKVGENGLPESDDEWYETGIIMMMSDERLLTLKTDMEFQTCDYQGKEIGKETFSKGSRFRIMKIKYPDQVMIYCKDNGKNCILNVNAEDYPQTCEGVSIYDIFDNVLFAG